jgi:hypothetical protein
MSTSYIQKMERTYNSNFVGHYPLDEESGTVAYDISPNGYNGTSVSLMRSWNDRQVLGPDGGKCAQFDGSASYVNIYSALASAPTTIGSISVWAALENTFLKGSTAGKIIKLAVDANNTIDITFDSTPYRFNGTYTANSTASSVNSSLVYNSGYGPTWHHFVLTWTKAGDALKFYVDGKQQGSTQTSLGTWSGTMASNLMVVGASSTAPLGVLKGWIARLGIWSVVLPPATVADLAVAGL